MIRTADLRDLVVVPVLQHLDLYSLAAEALCMGTIAHESLGGFHLRQVKGPALGIGQVEPDTHRDNWVSFLAYRRAPDGRGLGDRVAAMVPALAWRRGVTIKKRGSDGVRVPDPSILATDLAYSVAHMRIKYWRVPEPLPNAEDEFGLARYWNTYYNANPDHGTDEEWVRAYRSRVLLETAPR